MADQCPKLSFYVVHPQGALLLKRDFLHALSYNTCSNELYFKLSKKHVNYGCTPPKSVHPAVEMYMPGAGCTLIFGHCYGRLISAFSYILPPGEMVI